MAGIANFPLARSGLADRRAEVFDLPAPLALLVPGAAPHRPAKRWPAARFAALAQDLAARGLTPVVLGTKREAPAAGLIAVVLSGRDRPYRPHHDGRHRGGRRPRRVAVGNDTGPMHVAAAVGCPCVVLFSATAIRR